MCLDAAADLCPERYEYSSMGVSSAELQKDVSTFEECANSCNTYRWGCSGFKYTANSDFQCYFFSNGKEGINSLNNEVDEDFITCRASNNSLLHFTLISKYETHAYTHTHTANLCVLCKNQMKSQLGLKKKAFLKLLLKR